MRFKKRRAIVTVCEECGKKENLYELQIGYNFNTHTAIMKSFCQEHYEDVLRREAVSKIYYEPHQEAIRKRRRY